MPGAGVPARCCGLRGLDGLALGQRSGLPRRCLHEVLVGKWMGRPYPVSGIRLSDLCLNFIVILFKHT